MKVAICCEREDAEGLVPLQFESSPFLLLIDVERNVIYDVCRKQDPDNLGFADRIVEENCEAVICGTLEKQAFERLAGAGVSRYDGSRRKAQRAFLRFLRNQLPLTRDYQGGPGPVGHSHDFSCSHEEEEPEEHREPLSCRHEDHLFEISPEEAAALPDELEVPDDLNREQVEKLLQSFLRPVPED